MRRQGLKSKPNFETDIRSAMFLFFVFLVFATGCQTKPTVVRETVSRSFEGSRALLGPIELSDEVIVADARSPFDYSMARVPRSVSINWADYTETAPNQRGWPQKDLFAAARRLARLGIGPKSKVVVLGQGADGQGEEGRVAWMLAYLGVSDVRFGRFGSVKSRITTEALPESAQSAFTDESSKRSLQPAEPPTAAQPLWKPEVVSSLIVTREEILGAMKNVATSRPWSFGGAPARLYRIIDVRPEAEYLGKKGGIRSKVIPNIEAINVPWKEFFNLDFRPLEETAQRLLAVGVESKHRVILIDNDGIASCASTMALRAFGYLHAGCFAGGYNDLMK